MSIRLKLVPYLEEISKHCQIQSSDCWSATHYHWSYDNINMSNNYLRVGDVQFNSRDEWLEEKIKDLMLVEDTLNIDNIIQILTSDFVFKK